MVRYYWHALQRKTDSSLGFKISTLKLTSSGEKIIPKIMVHISMTGVLIAMQSATSPLDVNIFETIVALNNISVDTSKPKTLGCPANSNCKQMTVAIWLILEPVTPGKLQKFNEIIQFVN